mgnify:CR=1 FL=1|tara:strand:+ start:1019 stop:2014 length:996 start_codon:yes stop_codon:yes gene_type:complete
MATYKGIHGYRVESLSSDPPAETSLGQLWYNTTSGVLKYSIEGAGTWAAGNNMTAVQAQMGFAGIQTACIQFGGSNAAGTPDKDCESYNGTSWTESADIPTLKYQNAGFGTSTAAISAGGLTPPAVTNETFVWDGTSWTAGNDLVDATRNIHGCGTQTAGLIAGGQPTSRAQDTATYDGTSWTETNDLQAGRNGIPVVGTTTAALAIGGNPASGEPSSVAVEIYDGTSWTEGNNILDARIEAGASGTTTSALLFGGYGGGHSTTLTANCETWDGTSWTEGNNMGTARAWIGTGQTSPSTASLAFGGDDPAKSRATEEFNSPVYTIKTVTSS